MYMSKIVFFYISPVMWEGRRWDCRGTDSELLVNEAAKPNNKYSPTLSLFIPDSDRYFRDFAFPVIDKYF
jgi:hypothetical protein